MACPKQYEVDEKSYGNSYFSSWVSQQKEHRHKSSWQHGYYKIKHSMVMPASNSWKEQLFILFVSMHEASTKLWWPKKTLRCVSRISCVMIMLYPCRVILVRPANILGIWLVFVIFNAMNYGRTDLKIGGGNTRWLGFGGSIVVLNNLGTLLESNDIVSVF